jgi:flagellar assembly factor FliW
MYTLTFLLSIILLKNSKEEAMKFTTVRFGEIEVTEENIISFSKGILGFDEYKRFILFPADEKQDTPFYFLQSVEEGSLCFFILNTFSFFPDYDIELEDALVTELEVAKPEDVLVFTIVTVQGNLKEATTNLKAPVIINLNKKLARQVVIEKGDYLIKQPLFSEDVKPSIEVVKG